MINQCPVLVPKRKFWNLRKLGKFRIMSKPHEIINQCAVFFPKILSILAKDSLKIEIELFPQCATSHAQLSGQRLNNTFQQQVQVTMAILCQKKSLTKICYSTQNHAKGDFIFCFCSPSLRSCSTAAGTHLVQSLLPVWLCSDGQRRKQLSWQVQTPSLTC